MTDEQNPAMQSVSRVLAGMGIDASKYDDGISILTRMKLEGVSDGDQRAFVTEYIEALSRSAP